LITDTGLKKDVAEISEQINMKTLLIK
jgi:hypothetical protein